MRQTSSTSPTPAAEPRPSVEAGGFSAAVAFLIVQILVALLALSACGDQRPRPTAEATSEAPSRTASPRPAGTRPVVKPADLTPLASPTDWRPLVESRGVLSVPEPPSINFGRTHTIKHAEGTFEEGVLVGAQVWTDLFLFWSQPDPTQVDYYEVWRSPNEPYFTPGSCVSCSLVLTTTGQRGVFPESPPKYNPYTSYLYGSEFDFYQVRAVNGSGTSDSSTTMGIMNYIIGLGSAYDWNGNVLGLPTPGPTRGPSPTPANTLTPTPQGSVTPGPSPTP